MHDDRTVQVLKDPGLQSTHCGSLSTKLFACRQDLGLRQSQKEECKRTRGNHRVDVSVVHSELAVWAGPGAVSLRTDRTSALDRDYQLIARINSEDALALYPAVAAR